MSAVAHWMGAAAMVCVALSALGMIFLDRDGRRHSEYQTIGWAIVAALMWLVAK